MPTYSYDDPPKIRLEIEHGNGVLSAFLISPNASRVVVLREGVWGIKVNEIFDTTDGREDAFEVECLSSEPFVLVG